MTDLIKIAGETPLEIKVLEVTPSIASEMLDRNVHNRSVSPLLVAKYAQAMRKGAWTFVGDPLRIADDGMVLDGQHRLWAVVKSGVPINFVVVSGLPVEAQMCIDQGRKRSAHDQLRIMGVPYYMNAAPIAKTLIMWEQCRLSLLNRIDVSPSIGEIVTYVEKHQSMIRWGSQTVVSMNHNQIPAPSSSVGAVLARVFEIDPYAAERFAQGLTTGADLEANSAILWYRRYRQTLRANRTRLSVREDIYYTVRTWNAWRGGKDVQQTFRLPPTGLLKDSDIPALV